MLNAPHVATIRHLNTTVLLDNPNGNLGARPTSCPVDSHSTTYYLSYLDPYQNSCLNSSRLSLVPSYGAHRSALKIGNQPSDHEPLTKHSLHHPHNTSCNCANRLDCMTILAHASLLALHRLTIECGYQLHDANDRVVASPFGVMLHTLMVVAPHLLNHGHQPLPIPW